MAINPNGVSVPAQSKTLDTTTVTTAYGTVHRQVVALGDPETPTSYVTLTGSSLNVNITTASIAVTAAALPLPTGAATETTVSSINAKTPALGQALAAASVPIVLTAEQLTTLTPLTTLPNVTTLGSITNTVVIKADTAGNQTNALKVDGTATTQPISVSSLPLPTGAATESTLAALSAKVVNGSSFSHISTNATTTVKSGAGVLKRITINSNGGTLNTATVYDNTAGSGTIIAVIDTTLGGNHEYDLVFSTGLTIVTATGTAADLTVVYQ